MRVGVNAQLAPQTIAAGSDLLGEHSPAIAVLLVTGPGNDWIRGIPINRARVYLIVARGRTDPEIAGNGRAARLIGLSVNTPVAALVAGPSDNEVAAGIHGGAGMLLVGAGVGTDLEDGARRTSGLS